ncbi:flagellar biosynthesis protein FlhB [Pseudarthrobacter sp. NPDC092424]|uniref:EscU/YscU/HrcU family type III secretion system export apparatus switch protein n=1 Tax=Pseudarthrobacter sp. NPDC092424 TaxID=3364415 RepID=UPI00382B4B9F
MSQDSGERTEQATEKRMKEVRSKGQLSKSQDLTAWLGIGAAALMMPSTLDRAAQAANDQLFNIPAAVRNPDPDEALRMLADGLASMGASLLPMLGVVLLAVFLGAAGQGGINFRKFRGKFEQFNLAAGMKQTFGTQALWQGVKALLKTAVVGLVLYLVIQGLVPVLMTAGGLSVASLLASAGGGIGALIQYAVAAGIVLALADVWVVMRRNRKRTRMTKKEVKDEHKNSDGDPLVKSQRRSRQLSMSRNRMIAAVGESDVVLVNPTHIAVALRYEAGKSAPRVTAKGAGHIALRIREEAEARGVPLVRDVPLARALHASCEIGQEIPVELYSAVAAVLAFTMQLKARGSAAGTHTINSHQVPAPQTPATGRHAR